MSVVRLAGKSAEPAEQALSIKPGRQPQVQRRNDHEPVERATSSHFVAVARYRGLKYVRMFSWGLRPRLYARRLLRRLSDFL